MAEGLHRRQIQRRQALGGEHFCGRTQAIAAVAIEQQCAIGEALGQRRIVQGGDDARAAGAQIAEQTQDLDLVMRIQMIARLIQQIDLRLPAPAERPWPRAAAPRPRAW